MKKQVINRLCQGALLAFLCGCAASPTKDSGFLKDSHKMKKNEKIPAQKVWVAPESSIADYKKILIKPVFTKKQVEKTFLENMNIYTYLSNEKKDTKAFASYIRNAFAKAIKKSKRFQLASAPGPKTMVLELALVKVVPGKPVLGTIKNVGRLTPIGFILSPVTMGIDAASDSALQSSVAIEGQIIDSVSGKPVAMFADRRKQKTAYFNTKDFRPFGNPEQIADEWASDFVKVLETRPLETGKKVETKSSLGVINY